MRPINFYNQTLWQQISNSKKTEYPSNQHDNDGDKDKQKKSKASGGETGGDKNVPGGEWDFMGEGSVPYTGDAWVGTNFIGLGQDVNPYTLKLRPVDAIDKAAQRHDYYYWKEGASGIHGAVFDKSVAYADMILVCDAYNIMQSYREGGMDEVTGLPISERTYNIARGVYYSFLLLTITKIRP